VKTAGGPGRKRAVPRVAASGLRGRLPRGLLLWDGAMGTMLQEAGLARGAAPEEVCLSRPDAVREIHAAYRAAGAAVLTTNTFGANRIKLASFGLERQVAAINAAAVAAAKMVAGKKGLVAGSVGPTGTFVEPLGPLSFAEAASAFREQARALADAGADLVKIETMMDLRELKAALLAARETGLPVVAMMTFEESGATLLGTTPEAFGVTAEAMGAFAVGLNCSLGPGPMLDLAERLLTVASGPVMVQPNAGIPALVGERTVFPMDPEDFASFAPRFRALGVDMIAGCCGTTPGHIRAARRALIPEGRATIPRAPRPIVPEPLLRVASRGRVVSIGGGSLAVVGERINPTGKRAFAEELRCGEMGTVTREARAQADLGADILDVNVGAPGVDEPALMRRAVFAANTAADLPVMIDSSDPEAIRAGLECADGRPIINSVTGERRKLDAILPLAALYGAALVCLPFSEEGIPMTPSGRLAVARRIVRAARRAGVPKESLIVDGLATTISASADAGRVTLDTIRAVREDLGLPTILGVSNVSFGLPNRGLVNRAFLALAMERGLAAAIVNPHDAEMGHAAAAVRLLLGGTGSAAAYVERFAGKEAGAKAEPAGTADDPFHPVARAVLQGDAKGAAAAVEDLLARGVPPLEVSEKGLLPGMAEVGRRFERNIVFLPQVMASAEAMKAGFAHVREAIGPDRRAYAGKVLLATVEGDVHDIGKNIVATLLENHGFEVIDLGKNVPAARIVSEARRRRPDVVGLSALMTTTMSEMKTVVALLEKEGIRTLSIVGGAVVTEEFAERIGASLYARDGMDAVRKLSEAMSRQRPLPF
jgi:5-methyltetrahydrofolate--homocysteine methyltransferase